MYRICISSVLVILVFVSASIAQQAASNSSVNPQQGLASTSPGSVIGGDGMTNYIPIWARPNYLLSSVIYQSSAGNVGVGTTTPGAKIDVNGSANVAATYQIGESTVLGIGNSADNNVFVGVGAGANNLAGQGNFNMFSGYEAGYANTSGRANTFSGAVAGQSNTTGQQNTFFGTSAGYNNTTGGFNTFTGAQAGASNTTGGNNTFTGDSAGHNNTTGSGNTFTGLLAGSVNSTGHNNTFTGLAAGYYNSTGDDNTITGVEAGGSNTTGSENTFEGTGSGGSNTTGTNNTFIGTIAGQYNTTASYNTFIGFQAGDYNTTGSNNIYIGSTGPSSGTESNTIRIGGGAISIGPQTATYIVGIYGVNAGGIPVTINANGQLGAPTSSLRFKEQVHDMGDSTAGLMKLRPVTFVYKPEYADGEPTLQYGLIAEEVAKIYPELVAYDNDGQPYAVRYQYLNTMLLNEAQKQYRRAEVQQQKIEQLEERLSRLEEVLQRQAQLLSQK